MPRRDAGASSSFRIFETDEFLKRLKKLTPRDADSLRRKLEEYVYPQLRKNPFLGPNIKKLKGYTPDVWRYRIGDFRVFFLVEQGARTVFMLSADNRRDAYR